MAEEPGTASQRGGNPVIVRADYIEYMPGHATVYINRKRSLEIVGEAMAALQNKITGVKATLTTPELKAFAVTVTVPEGSQHDGELKLEIRNTLDGHFDPEFRGVAEGDKARVFHVFDGENYVKTAVRVYISGTTSDEQTTDNPEDGVTWCGISDSHGGYGVLFVAALPRDDMASLTQKVREWCAWLGIRLDGVITKSRDKQLPDYLCL